MIAGIPAAQLALAEYDAEMNWNAAIADGTAVVPGATIATISGSARNLLTAERTVLNLLGRLSGIATLTCAFVTAVEGTKAQIYDTRKTMPGWRRLEKYAVHAGGGRNHRLGLCDGILIKDNHLAFGAIDARYSPATAIDRCRHVVASLAPVLRGADSDRSRSRHAGAIG